MIEIIAAMVSIETNDTLMLLLKDIVFSNHCKQNGESPQNCKHWKTERDQKKVKKKHTQKK